MNWPDKIEQAHLLNLTRSEKVKNDYEATCKHFGCGKKLSLIESLAGKYCTNHSGGRKIDVMKVLKFK